MKGRKTGGRVRGVPNKATRAIREALAQLFTPTYFARLPERLAAGKLAPQLEAKLLAYRFGEPAHTVEIPALEDMASALSRKVVHELHPGPSQAE